jgi:hypothetical protein
MPDAPAKPAAGSKMGFLSRKIGPVPIWVIGLVAVGGYYWYTHYGPGKPAPAATTATTTTAGPEIIEVRGDRGPRGKTGPKGPAGPEPAKIAVPNVVGKSYTQGGREIQRAGLIGQRSAPYVGKIQSESPHAGTRVERGTVVTLRGKPWKAPSRGAQPATAAPVMASAPMTAGDIYGQQPTAMPNGQTYDSGDAMAAIGAASAIAG